jgi:hypothetical protein
MVVVVLSTLVLKEYPVGWLPELQGHYFDEESWDGSDIFMHAPDQTGKEVGHILASRKVKDLFEEANVGNVVLDQKLIPTAQQARDVFTGPSLTVQGNSTFYGLGGQYSVGSRNTIGLGVGTPGPASWPRTAIVSLIILLDGVGNIDLLTRRTSSLQT